MDKMKSYLLYLVKFSENNSIVPKKYSHNCIIGRPDQQPIIMIIYDESTFSTNDDYWKVWTYNSQDVLQPKRK